MKPITIDRAIADKRLLGAGLGPLETWSTWLVGMKAGFALPLDDAEREVFAAISGNRPLPTRRAREIWCLVGRRGGKSRMAALLATYAAFFVPVKLAAGEVGTVLVLAASLDQAQTVFNYIEGFINASPVLRKEVVSSTKSEIRLRSGVLISTHPASFRSVRGRSILCAIFDEIAFWRSEDSAAPDFEVFSAVLPALASTKGILIGISTPYRKMGLLHQKWRDNYGIDTGDDILVLQGATEQFNSTLDAREIASQRRADPTAADAEWGAQFRGELSAFLSAELIERAIDYARPIELNPMTHTYYKAFVDASGGTGHDAYTLAIAHMAGKHFVLDLCYGTPPGQSFDPDEVTQRYSKVCKRFGISTVIGDHYSAGWVLNSWKKTGVTYVQSEVFKSQIYLETAPLFSAGLIRIPDHAKLIRELRLLERRTHRSGKDTVDHGKNSGRDDYANATCGAFHSLAANLYGYPSDEALLRICSGDSGPPPVPVPIPPRWAPMHRAPSGLATAGIVPPPGRSVMRWSWTNQSVMPPMCHRG